MEEWERQLPPHTDEEIIEIVIQSLLGRFKKVREHISAGQLRKQTQITDRSEDGCYVIVNTQPASPFVYLIQVYLLGEIVRVNYFNILEASETKSYQVREMPISKHEYQKSDQEASLYTVPFQQREEQRVLPSTLILEDAFEIYFSSLPISAPETCDQLQSEEMIQSASLLWIPLAQPVTLNYHYNQFSPDENKGMCRWIFIEEESPSCHVLLEVYPFLPNMEPFRIDFLVAEWYMLLLAIGQQGRLWIVAGPAYTGGQETINIMEKNAFYQTLLDEYPQRLPLILDPDTLQGFTQRITRWKDRFILLFTDYHNKR